MYISEVRSRTTYPLYKLQGQTPHDIVAWDTTSVTEWLEYEFCQPVWLYSPAAFPIEKPLLGRWLGGALKLVQAPCYLILSVSGAPIARSLVQPFSKDDLATKDVVEELASCDMSKAKFLAE